MAPRVRTSDDGFSIVEVVVAVVILAMAVTVLAALMTRTLGLAQSNTQRTTAANLATQQVEKLQTMRALDIPDGRVTIGPITVGGTPYTIYQSSKYVTVDGSACSGTTSSDLTSKVVTLRVTWPNMGNVKSVRSATIRALGTGSNDLSGTTGAAAVAVQNAIGDGTAGISVTLMTAPGGTVVATQTSGDDGCVVFAGLAPGNYTASANTVGYVNLDGVQATTSCGVRGDGVDRHQGRAALRPARRPGRASDLPQRRLPGPERYRGHADHLHLVPEPEPGLQPVCRRRRPGLRLRLRATGWPPRCSRRATARGPAPAPTRQRPCPPPAPRPSSR